MSEKMFDIDTTEIEKLARFFGKKAPEKFAKATGSVLNEFAFGTRNTAIEVIREKMIVRNPRFVESRLQVTKSPLRGPIEAQQSTIGSVAMARFSGWREQQTGERTARERVINLLARSKSKKRQERPKARMKPGRTFPKYTDYPGQTPEQKSIVMMQKIFRARSTEAFIITQKSGMVPGLYRFYRRKPRLLQVFKVEQPKRVPWMIDARSRYFQRENLSRLFGRTLDRLLPRSL